VRSVRVHKIQETLATRSGPCIRPGEQLTAVVRRFPELGTIYNCTGWDRGMKCVANVGETGGLELLKVNARIDCRAQTMNKGTLP